MENKKDLEREEIEKATKAFLKKGGKITKKKSKEKTSISVKTKTGKGLNPTTNHNNETKYRATSAELPTEWTTD